MSVNLFRIILLDPIAVDDPRDQNVLKCRKYLSVNIFFLSEVMAKHQILEFISRILELVLLFYEEQHTNMEY